MAHTPGTWTVVDYSDIPDGEVWVEAGPQSECLCVLYPYHYEHHDYPMEQLLDNARLIAKAPELLEALEYCLSHIYNRDEDIFYEDDAEWWPMLREITKLVDDLQSKSSMSPFWREVRQIVSRIRESNPDW